MTERKAGKSGANDALNVAIKKFGDNIIAERGAGSELANYDIILTVARNSQMGSCRRNSTRSFQAGLPKCIPPR